MHNEKKIEFLRETIDLLLLQKRFEKTQSYLLDYDFIREKTIFIGISELIEDYKNLLKDYTPSQQKKEALELILSSLEQASHILIDYPKQINSQLIGYLEKGINIFLDNIITSIDKKTKGVWLKPLIPSFLDFQKNSQVMRNYYNRNIKSLTYKKGILLIVSTKRIEKLRINKNKSHTLYYNDLHEITDVELFEKQGKYYLVIACWDKEKKSYLLIFDISRKLIISKLYGHSDKIEKIKILKNRKLIITIANDNTARIWNISSSKNRQTLKLSLKTGSKATGLVIFENEQNVITSTLNGIIRIWNIKTNKLLKELYHKAVVSLTISSNQMFLLSISNFRNSNEITTGNVLLYSLKTFSIIQSFQLDNTFYNTYAQFISIPYIYDFTKKRFVKKRGQEIKNKNDTHILISWNKFIKLYDLLTKEHIMTLLNDTIINSVIKFTKKQRLLSVGVNGRVVLWDLLNGEKISSLNIPFFSGQISLSNDEKSIIIGLANGKVHLIKIIDDIFLSSKI